jgi:hypothetical protein
MRLLALLGVLCAVAATSFAAIGDTTWWFPSRDWTNRSADSTYANAGQAAAARISKGNPPQENYMFDLESWEYPAQPRTQLSQITAWTAAHPLDPANYYDYYKYEYDITAASGSDGSNGPDAADWGGHITRVQWRTLEMTVDWAEGSGWQFQSAGGLPFNWPIEEKAATNAYAQTAYMLDATYTPVLDAANSIPWTGRNGVVKGDFRAGDYLTSPNSVFNLVNTAYTLVDATTANPAWAANLGNYHVRTVIDQAIMDDIFNNPNNRGLSTVTAEWYDPVTDTWAQPPDNNSLLFTLDRSTYLDPPANTYLWNYAGNTGQGPRFYVTVDEKQYHPGDATKDGHVNVDDLGVLASNYDGTGKVWTQADFTADGAVNVDDLGVLASNYDWVGPGASIPEPATLSLLGLGALALIRRKR